MDSRWRNVTLGNTNFRIGRWGCLVTDLSMLTDYFRKFRSHFYTPGELAKKLSFNSQGQLLWGSLPKVCNFRLEKRLRYQDNVEIQKSLAANDKAVILEVDGTHWITALRKLPFNLYWCADPLRGDKCLSSRYKKITGSAHIISIYP